MSSEEGLPGKGRHWFATTRWSLVLAAGNNADDDSDSALAELCTQYWSPLYAYARRRGYNADDARDLTQAFFVKLLENRDLQAADQTRGRFRTFLLAAMKNFISGQWRKDNAQKRGGAVELLPLDFDSAEQSYGLEPFHELTPEAVYERRWALSLLDHAVTDLQIQYTRDGKAELFAALKGFLGSEQDVLPYAELSQQVGLSEGSLRTAVSRLRSRWRTRIRELVAETVDSEADVQDELRILISSFDSSL